MPLALVLIPMVPGLIAGLVAIIKAIQEDPATPEEVRRQYAMYGAMLDVTAAAVRNADIRRLT